MTKLSWLMKWVSGKEKSIMSALEINQSVWGEVWDSGIGKLMLADSLKSDQIRFNSGYIFSAKMC